MDQSYPDTVTFYRREFLVNLVCLICDHILLVDEIRIEHEVVLQGRHSCFLFCFLLERICTEKEFYHTITSCIILFSLHCQWLRIGSTIECPQMNNARQLPPNGAREIKCVMLKQLHVIADSPVQDCPKCRDSRGRMKA